ncbi:AAA ATPase [Physocladia obscura]|uniref:Cell division control protein n=1 Tax=Physocladia obscura TaxID=109957 RepID=A0AAD5SX67_9FUNG|nr:AAA ATPase [Physocladia obscura]
MHRATRASTRIAATLSPAPLKRHNTPSTTAKLSGAASADETKSDSRCVVLRTSRSQPKQEQQPEQLNAAKRKHCEIIEAESASSSSSDNDDADEENTPRVIPKHVRKQQTFSKTKRQPTTGTENKVPLPFCVNDDSSVTISGAIADAKAAFKPSSVHNGGRLVGRDAERRTIRTFLEDAVDAISCLDDVAKGAAVARSLYVCGVPGTGKSAIIDEILDDFLSTADKQQQEQSPVNKKNFVLANTEQQTQKQTFKLVKLNCMQFNNATSGVYKKIMAGFNVSDGAHGAPLNEPYRALEREFGHMDGGDVTAAASRKPTKKQHITKPSHPKTIHILVLDEIDHLASTPETLYRIYEWPALRGSSLVVIGIANALNFMQRYLPRLDGMVQQQKKSSGGGGGGGARMPMVLGFAPYTPAEISAIVLARLESVRGDVEKRIGSVVCSKDIGGGGGGGKGVFMMHPSAVEVCARKAAGTGDLRKALDLVRASFEVLEVEMMRNGGGGGGGVCRRKEAVEEATSTREGDQQPKLLPSDMMKRVVRNVAELPKVSIAHVLKAANSAAGPGPVQKVRGLATQQKAVLIALMDLIGVTASSNGTTGSSSCNIKGTLKDAIVGNLHDAYVTVLKRKDMIKPVTKTEFGDILSLFESIGLVTMGKAKEERLRKVRLECFPKQVEDGIRDDPVLWGIWIDLSREKGAVWVGMS